MAKLIGTAGHVDHGKTSLIHALTGIDADRLPEEKKRGMTIDIGFAYLDLPGLGRVSIVDVPGHEKFVTNMLVGALGIDVALLCVSADEAVMPQTREHFQILQLLPVDRMVVALTRADLADDETRGMAELDVAELLEGTRFEGCPVIPVSAHTGEGIDTLRTALQRALKEAEKAQDSKANLPWYLPIDRVFAVKGHGCVVTGTLAQGQVKVGDRAFIEPEHLEVRVRAIHSHGDALDASDRGRRTALNLGGVKVEDVRRGQAIGEPGALFPTKVLDASVTWVGERKHGLRVRVSIGSEEAIGKIFLSDVEPDLAQLRLESTIACALHQPLIIRRYSPPDLIAGGKVVVPQAKPRRKSEEVRLVQAGGSDEESILGVVGATPAGVETEEICRVLGKSPQALGDAFEKLSKEGRVLGFAGLWFSPEGFADARQKLFAALQSLHAKHPTQAALPRETVLQAASLPWRGKALDRILAHLSSEGSLTVSGTTIRDPQFKLQLSPKQRAFLDRVIEVLERSGVNVPGSRELAEAVHAPPQAIEEILRLGAEAGELVRVAEGLYYTRAGVERIKATVREISGGKPFPASAFRDAVGSSRKYVIPLLEYFDTIRFTLRVGDNRVVNER
ncbi:MAG TPA: selenocysteine-specific translation elongation factor [Fimbriimonadaceae bacterium]|nr:selenocysteine-specific translation elongation factor [Fimbriimonadaceae bacterium]